jgi:hypothetical protein
MILVTGKSGEPGRPRSVRARVGDDGRTRCRTVSAWTSARWRITLTGRSWWFRVPDTGPIAQDLARYA